MLAPFFVRAPVAAGPVTKLLDTFTGVPTTGIAAHVPDIPGVVGYVNLTGTWVLGATNNLINTDNGTAEKIVYYPLDVSDVTLTVDVTVPALNYYSFYIEGRIQDANNKWHIRFENDTNNIAIIENNGVDLVRASVAFTYALNTTYSVKVVFSGTTITASIGATSVSYSSASSFLTLKNFGVGEFRGAGVFNLSNSFDNLKITAP